jgi:hypothetical protein
MQDEQSIGAVEEGRNELLPAGVERRPPSAALKESDLTPEQLREIETRPDPLAGASHATLGAIREAMAEDAGDHATMPAPGRNDVSAEEVERRAARRATLDGNAPADAHGESFGGVVATVEESRRKLLAGQVPESAFGATGADADFAVRDAGAARVADMRRMAVQLQPTPSGAAIGGRVRSGDGGDALRAAGGTSPTRTATGGGGTSGNVTQNTGAGGSSISGAGGAGTPAGGAQGGSGTSGAGGGQGGAGTGT